jgi:hypothetical protein
VPRYLLEIPPELADLMHANILLFGIRKSPFAVLFSLAGPHERHRRSNV